MVDDRDAAGVECIEGRRGRVEVAIGVGKRFGGNA